jgi:hypothetical protein
VAAAATAIYVGMGDTYVWGATGTGGEDEADGAALGIGTLKMSTTAERVPAQSMRHRRQSLAIPSTKIAASKHRDTHIRQRCGRKIHSSLAEVCSAPSSRRRIEDVNYFREMETSGCTKHGSIMNTAHSPLACKPAIPTPSYPHPPTNATLRAIEKATNCQSSQNIHMPPEKIAIPTFGSDVAAR